MSNPETSPKPTRYLIDHGRRSDIFDLGNKTILKLYSSGFPEEKITLEFKNAKNVYEQTATIATPQPIKLIKEEDRAGIIFQAVEGQSYMNIFQSNPIKFFTLAKKLANIQDKISTNHIVGLPTQEESFTSLISDSQRLTPNQKGMLLNILDSRHLSMLCHGDFHHGNVIHSLSGRDYVIDWMDAFIGDPLLDVTLTAVNAAVSDAPAHVPVFYRNLYETLKKIMALDVRIISLHKSVDQIKLPKYLALAAGIHLSRFNGQNDRPHRLYFEHAMSNLN